jgi:hypothetical protein
MDKIKASQFADLAYYCRTPLLLPAIYQQVEYLQSSGTQYIDIGAMSNHQYYDVTFIYIGNVGSIPNAILGANGASNDVKVLIRTNGTVAAGVGEYNIGETSFSLTTGSVYNIYFSPTAFDVNGVSYKQRDGVFSGSKHAYVFAANQDYTSMHSALKIFRLKTSSIDLYPCYRKSDSKPGMYDLVAKTFFTNAGTGEFTVGGNV